MFKLIKRSPWLAIGAALGYLFDPVRGKSRRSRLGDQFGARVRDLTGWARRKIRFHANRVWGAAYESVAGETDLPRDDDHLMQKIRSEAVGRVDGDTGHVSIEVDEGVVTLRGISRDRSVENELVQRISDVTGVRSVRNLLSVAAVAVG